MILFLLISIELTNGQHPIGLKVIGSLRGIPMGSAFQVARLRNAIDSGQYNALLNAEYQIIVPEVELKPRSIWIGENIYNWNDSDWLLGATMNSTGWIQQNGFKLRGHNLVWAVDQWVPDWLKQQESTITPDKARSLLSDYIQTVVGRYRGKIPWWDVVNEAIDDVNNTRPFNLRDSFWFRKLGPDFIKYAFIFANQADPELQLYYNDFNIEYIGLKADRVRSLIDWLRSEGAIVHGIGMQWHISVSTVLTPGDEHYKSAQKFIDQNLKLMVTELDVSIPTIGGYPMDSEDLNRQGTTFRSIIQYVLHFLPSFQGLLTWGFTDRYSWIPSFWNIKKGAALPFDWMYYPKAAYWQIQEELARVLVDGKYVLSPQSQPNKCLGVANNGTTNVLQLYDQPCQSLNQYWNISWLNDGTYQLESLSNTNSLVLMVNNATEYISQVQVAPWVDNVRQEWVLVPEGENFYRIVPRTAYWRIMTVYDSSEIAIIDYDSSQTQFWTLNVVSM